MLSSVLVGVSTAVYIALMWITHELKRIADVLEKIEHGLRYTVKKP